MGAHSVEPGTVLADRYVVEDLLAEEGESRAWRARDRVLARSVVLHVLPSSSKYADEMLAAAKRASRVADPRILQVLDAVDDGELSYVVREWANGQSLDIILAEGPLPSRRAAWLMREVAAAIANGHRMGLPHRRLAPDTIIVTKSSGVKVIGLGTFAALRGDLEDGEDAEAADATDLGRLLYACLTSRWPGGPMSGLPAAPTEHGRLLRPRQVRAGVSRPLDVVCDRILGQPPRYGDPITTVGEVKDSLSEILAGDGFVVTTPGLPGPIAGPSPAAAPAPALLPADEDPTTGDQPAYGPIAAQQTDGSPLGRGLMWTVIILLVLSAMLLAYMIGQQGLNQDESAPPSEQQPPAGNGAVQPDATDIEIQGVQDFDPPPDGSGDEHPEDTGLAVDGDPSTSWETMRYDGNPELGGLKEGVGLVVDLGEPQRVETVTVTLPGDGTDVELRAAPDDAGSMPTASADDYTTLDRAQAASGETVLSPDEPIRTQFILVWLTSLPSEGGASYRGQVAEIEVAG